jgi:hypothetical protein
MAEVPFSKSHADQIASLFFDLQEVKSSTAFGMAMKLIFKTRTHVKTSTRHLSLYEAKGRMMAQGYTFTQAKNAGLFLTTHVMTIAFKALMAQQALETGQMVMNKNVDWNDRHYLGVRGMAPDVDFREQQAFLVPYKALFIDLILQNLNPGPRQYQHGPTSTNIHRI